MSLEVGQVAVDPVLCGDVEVLLDERVGHPAGRQGVADAGRHDHLEDVPRVLELDLGLLVLEAHGGAAVGPQGTINDVLWGTPRCHRHRPGNRSCPNAAGQ